MYSNMTSNTCKRCGLTACSKQALVRHFQKKNTCQPLLSDMPVQTLMDEIVIKEKVNKEKTIECPKCHKLFGYTNNMYVHRKTCRTVAVEEPHVDLQGEVTRLREEVDKLKTAQSASTTINNTNNVIINNINCNAFGKENLDHISNEFLHKCLLKTTDGITDLVNHIHFSKDAPSQNMNVFAKNLGKRNTFMRIVGDDGNWQIADKDIVLHKMLWNGYRILQEYFLDSKTRNDADVKEREDSLIEWFSEVGTIASKTYYKVKRDIYVLVYNNTLYVLQKTDTHQLECPP